ncbi:hypothetical protein L9F63_001173, partial [Diploptera punctata]
MASEEKQMTMVQEEDPSPVIMEGYLEKRGKMKLVSTWKRYWFVLKGQLLLYYKTQHECNNLSVCRGSLNMGLASCVRPGANRGPPANGTQGYTIEVVTRTQVIILRSKDRCLQEQWLKALLDSMALPISNPIRNSTSPMHFRYSLDNLPAIEEGDSEDKRKEKQSTLPHKSSITRHDSILGRIKKIGGTSYGGSLETIIKNRPKTQYSQQQSPQQPKIPRIKAVDRMLGLHQTAEDTSNDFEQQHTVNDKDSGIPENSFKNGVKIGNKCNNESKTKSEKCDVASSRGELQASSKEIELDNLNDTSIEMMNNNDNETYIRKNDKNQNCDNFDITKPQVTKNLTWNMIENEKHVIYIERQEDIVIENKLYDESSKTKSEAAYAEVDKKETKQMTKNIELESEQKGKKDEHDFEEEIRNYPKINFTKDGEKMYEEVKVEKEVKEVANDECDEDEEEYYSQYDKFSLLKSLSDQEQEPVLPPRPSVSSKSSHEFVNKQNQNSVKKNDGGDDDDGVEYNSLYETTLNTTTSNSKLEKSDEGTLHRKKRLRILELRRKKKKSLSNESVNSEDRYMNGDKKKKKRKMSFLRRMLKHYRKKPESQISTDDAEDSDPEYESVDYAAALTVQMETENDKTQSAPSEIESREGSPDKELHKERIFGTNLLSEQGMRELKMKLKVRDDSVDRDATPSPTAFQDKEKKECISSAEVSDKKPIPTTRLDKA